jgi:DNA-binding response OmpR family regulator
VSYVVGDVTGVFDNQALRSCGRLLLIDDNPKLCRMVKEYLEPLGYDVSLAYTGPDGLKKALQEDFHAVLLDVMLPGLDGFEVLKRIRATSTVPVIMLTARGEAPDRIAGLELGADDYIPKTFSPRELLARLRAVIRRSMATAALARREQQSTLSVGELCIDPHARSATFRGQTLSLTPTEFDLLLALARSPGKVKSREELLLEIADRDFEAFDRSIDMHVSSLRRKLGDDPKNPRLIVTVRAAGYLLKAPGDGQPP